MEKTYPIEGKVLHKGEPVRFAIINLEPVEAGKGSEARGTTDEEGTFKLRTYSNNEPDGAVPGEYKVTLEQYNPVKAGALPKDGKPTRITPEMVNPDVTVVIEAKEDHPPLNIDIP